MSPTIPSAPSPSDLQDYLDAANDASKRSRHATMVLVIGSVLALASLLNSLDANWMLQRMRLMAADPKCYVQEKIGLPDKHPDLDKIRLFYFNAALRSYIDHYSIKVPFFGVSLDTNDLGFVGGFGLLVTLLFLQFSLTRERDNLRWTFDAARQHGREEFTKLYYLLAMRQVLTSPPPQASKNLPILLVFLPLVVQLLIVINDFLTLDVARMISNVHALTVMGVEFGWLILMFLVTGLCVGVLKEINDEWRDKWELVEGRQVLRRRRGKYQPKVEEITIQDLL